MKQLALEQLKEIKNTVSDKFLEIYEGKQAESTDYGVFTDYKNYKSKTDYLSSIISGEFNKTLVNTPLIFVKGQFPVVVASEEKQGFNFGILLIDYISKKPYIVIVFDGKFKTLTYDVTAKTYTSKTFSPTVSTEAEVIAETKNIVSNLIAKF